MSGQQNFNGLTFSDGTEQDTAWNWRGTYSNSSAYAVGDVAFFNYQLVRFKVAIAAGTTPGTSAYDVMVATPVISGTASALATAYGSTTPPPNFTFYESDTGLTKYGDGSTSWSNLPYRGGTVIDAYNTPGSYTWTKRPGAKLVTVFCVGGGGSGGSGAVQASGTSSTGGSAGSGGGWCQYLLNASDCGATESVVVGAGGVGAASRSSGTGSGNNGSYGNPSTFGSGTGYIYAGSGSPGQAGTTTAASAPTGSYAQNGGGSSVGGGSNVGAAGSNSSIYINGPGTGGGGGSVSTTPTAYAGGVAYLPMGLSNAGVGANGGAVNTSGSNGTSPSKTWLFGSGGGGGGASSTTSGGNGGSGGFPGGGGGGGGAAIVSGRVSGAGGTGGNGQVIVITEF